MTLTISDRRLIPLFAARGNGRPWLQISLLCGGRWSGRLDRWNGGRSGWRRNVAKSRRPDDILANLCNAPEYLDEANFEKGAALPGDSAGRSLKTLPGSQIGLWTENGLAFGLLDVHEVERARLAIVTSVEDELMDKAEGWWVEMGIGR